MAQWHFSALSSLKFFQMFRIPAICCYMPICRYSWFAIIFNLNTSNAQLCIIMLSVRSCCSVSPVHTVYLFTAICSCTNASTRSSVVLFIVGVLFTLPSLFCLGMHCYRFLYQVLVWYCAYLKKKIMIKKTNNQPRLWSSDITWYDASRRRYGRHAYPVCCSLRPDPIGHKTYFLYLQLYWSAFSGLKQNPNSLML